MKSGVLNLYKEKGFTSHDAVAKVRRLFQTKKVGHTGTLDPQASGVLPILIGNAVKACSLIPEESKTYRATVRFGLTTDTEDIWGRVLAEDPRRPEREAFEKALSAALGSSQQIPPMISAVKVGGKKLYEYAREGKIVEREPRDIFVHEISLLSFSREEATVRARVSKGTYIRTLLVDLCQSVGVLGAMSALEREKSGMFSLEQSVKLEEIESLTGEEREALLLPTEDLFSAFPIYELPPFFDRLILNGCAVSAQKMGLVAQEGQRFRLSLKGDFLALGQIVREKGEMALKKIKDFPKDGEA